jgi:hypothetical protein
MTRSLRPQAEIETDDKLVLCSSSGPWADVTRALISRKSYGEVAND